MGRTPCCDKQGLKKGSWTEEEDRKLLSYVQQHGEGGWRFLPEKAGLLRCGKSCRLRYANYLRPGIKRGEITPEEEEIIIQLHAVLGNKWSTIARQLYKRTDNEIKNYWNTRLKRRVAAKMCSSTSSSTTTTVDHVTADHQTTIINSPGTDHLVNPRHNNVHNVENNKAPIFGDHGVISGATSAPISITRDVNKGAILSTPTPTSSYCGSSTSASTTTSDFDQVCRPASTSARILNKIASNLTLLNLSRVVVGGGDGSGGGAGESSVDRTKGSSVDEFSPYGGCNSGSSDSSTPSNVDPVEHVSPAQHTGFSALSGGDKFMCHEGMEIDHDLEMFLSETDAYEIAKEVLEGDNVYDHEQMLVTSFPNGFFFQPTN